MRIFALAAAVCALFTAQPAQAQRSFDIVIEGGRVLDGGANPAFRADVGVSGDRITAIGDLSAARARTRIDARGRIVAPGFIDIHSHAYDPSGENGAYAETDDDPRRRAAPNLVAQGITSVVINQDGRSPWPLADQRRRLERGGIGTNALLMVGHGAVRGRVMGEDHRRAATAEEIGEMRALVREAMRAGAYGLSAGLEYRPGRWAETAEVIALAEEIAAYRGVYISHQRAEGTDPMWYWPSQDSAAPPTLLDSVRETIEIGEQSGAIVVASHIKVKGAHYWGVAGAVIHMIESARARGVQIYADQYPYPTSGTDGETVLLPPWALLPAGEGMLAESAEEEADFAARLEAILAAPARAAALRRDIAHEISRRGGADQILLLSHPNAAFAGRTLAQLAAARGVGAVEMAILLQTEGERTRPGGAHLRGFSMSEIDLDAYAAQRWTATASDAGIALPEDGAGVHPRFYGSFPRKIRRYALERGVLSLEDAVRSATSLPAQIMGLSDRGVLREGAYADIVVFDAETIRDTAEVGAPHQMPEGIDWVLVNGRAVVADGALTGARPGRVLLNPRRR